MTHAEVNRRRPVQFDDRRRRHEHVLAGLPAGREHDDRNQRFPYFLGRRQRLRDARLPTHT